MKNTKNNITELVFILDKSGSMHGLESDTVGGYNSVMEKQKKEDGECYVTTVFFNSESETVHDRVKLSEIKPLKESDYTVGGCTALIDAIGDAVTRIETIHKYIRKEDVPDHTMFVIMTDGLENASHKFDSKTVKKLIEKHKEKDGWEFLFIGANIDSVETAKNFGIERERAVNYHADKKGTGVVYGAVAEAICCMRKEACVSPEWSKSISEDYEKRK